MKAVSLFSGAGGLDLGRRLISPDCPQPVRVESAVGVGQPAPTAAGGQP